MALPTVAGLPRFFDISMLADKAVEMEEWQRAAGGSITLAGNADAGAVHVWCACG